MYPYSLPAGFDPTDRVCISIARGFIPFAAHNNNYLTNREHWSTTADWSTATQEIYRQDQEMVQDTGPCYYIADGSTIGETKTATWDGSKWVIT